MKVLVVLALCMVVALTSARPSEIVDFETDDMEQEVEGQAGRSVTGEYSWVAPDGNEYYIKYIADERGYRILEDNVVPESPDNDLPEAEDDDDE